MVSNFHIILLLEFTTILDNMLIKQELKKKSNNNLY